MAAHHPTDEEIRAKYPGTLELCWWNDDAELLLLRGDRDESRLCRCSWPDDVPFLESGTDLWESAWGLAAPLRAPYAAVATVQDGESGVVIVDLQRMESIASAVYASDELIGGLAFSPDDRLFVAVFERESEPEEEIPADPGMVVMGSLVIAMVGEWDFLEVPLMVPKSEGLEWGRLDEMRPLMFVDDHRMTFEGPGGQILTVDLERLRTEPRWLEARARRRHVEKAEREEEKRTLREIEAHNTKAAGLARQMERSGLTCPYCSGSGKGFLFLHGTKWERALLVCAGCGRTLPI